MPTYDASQDIKNVTADEDGTTTTISFIRPRSSDNSQDIDLDQCVFIIYAFGGSVSNHTTPASFGQHSRSERGVFATQLCLQECG